MLLKKQPKKGACHALYCTNKSAPGRKLCEKCRKRLRKETNEVSYVYANLKQNAKRRGKEFTITLNQFKEWCDQTGYLKARGRTGGSATVDRIDQEKGYHIDNIQIMTNSANIRKYFTDYYRSQYEQIQGEEPTYSDPNNEFDNWPEEVRATMDTFDPDEPLPF